MEIEQESGTFSRRSAVKKAAVAGAIAWTTPMVLSSTARAAAGTCVDIECKKLYVFKSEDGVACVSYNDTSNHCPDTIHAVARTGYVRQRCPEGVTGGYPGPITLPLGYHFVNAIAKDGSFKVQPAFEGQSPATEDEMCYPVGGSVTVGADCRETVQIPGKSDGGYSHVYVIVCAPEGPDSSDCGAYRTYAYAEEGALAVMPANPADSPKQVTATTEASAPATTEAPVKTEAPATTQAPATTEAPVKTEAPATTQAPTTTQAPATTQAPTTTTTPPTTAAPADVPPTD